MLLLRLERNEDALDALKRSIEIKPDYAMAHLFLGQLYEKEGMSGSARQSYGRASAYGAGTREGEMADVALRRLRNWRLNASIGNTIDSNIAYKSKRQTGVSTGQNLSLSYNIYSVREKGLTTSASLSRSLNYKNQLSGITYSGNVGWRHQVRDIQSYNISAKYIYSTFENTPSYRQYSYSASTSLSPRAIPAALSMSYSFSDTTSFVNKVSDATQHSVSMSVSQNLSLRDRISGSYSFSAYVNKDPRGSNYAKRSNSLSAAYSRNITSDLSAGGDYSVSLVSFSNPDLTTFFTRYRRNISQSVGASMSYNLSENVAFSLSVDISWVTTNLGNPTAEERQKLEDILAAPVPMVGGGYRKETANMNVSVAF